MTQVIGSPRSLRKRPPILMVAFPDRRIDAANLSQSKKNGDLADVNDKHEDRDEPC